MFFPCSCHFQIVDARQFIFKKKKDEYLDANFLFDYKKPILLQELGSIDRGLTLWLKFSSETRETRRLSPKTHLIFPQ